MLESNYRTWCAQNDIAVEDGPLESAEGGAMDIVPDVKDGEDEEEWDGIMDVDDDDDDIPEFFKEEADLRIKEANARNSKRRKKGKVAELIREKVRRILEDETELAEKRARSCDEGDFLKLLWAFNKEGIHFN